MEITKEMPQLQACLPQKLSRLNYFPLCKLFALFLSKWKTLKTKRNLVFRMGRDFFFSILYNCDIPECTSYKSLIYGMLYFTEICKKNKRHILETARCVNAPLCNQLLKTFYMADHNESSFHWSLNVVTSTLVLQRCFGINLIPLNQVHLQERRKRIYSKSSSALG